MKLFMVLGGFIGFGMVLLLGLAQGSSWPGVFWRASVAALIAGLLMRWWGRVWLRSLWITHRERSAPPVEPATPTRPGTARV